MNTQSNQVCQRQRSVQWALDCCNARTEDEVARGPSPFEVNKIAHGTSAVQFSCINENTSSSKKEVTDARGSRIDINLEIVANQTPQILRPVTIEPKSDFSDLDLSGKLSQMDPSSWAHNIHQVSLFSHYQPTMSPKAHHPKLE
ncbi:hypothetical protein FCV25MIE_34397 [Fagus crenata]